jgi:hypothetical protein
LIVPPVTLSTVQPAWVQTAVNAANEPAFGWVITTFWAARTFPPPAGMSVVLASAAGPPEPEPGFALAGPAGEEPPAGSPCPDLHA